MNKALEYTLPKSPEAATAVCASLAGVIAVAGTWVISPYWAAFLYLIPITVAGARLDRAKLFAAIAFATIADALCGCFPGTLSNALPWSLVLLTVAAYAGTGLFVSEYTRHARAVNQLSEEVEARERIQRLVENVVEGVPGAVLNVDAEGNIVAANESAYNLLNDRSLVGRPVERYFPMLGQFRQSDWTGRIIRTLVEGTVQRTGAGTVDVEAWLSRTNQDGFTICAFLTSRDTTADDSVFHERMINFSILLGSLWKELRTYCYGLVGLTDRLKALPTIADAEELEAVDALVHGLNKLTASAEVSAPSAEEEVASLRAVLDQLRILIEPWVRESKVTIKWPSEDLPLVRADHHGLLHVLLNLTRKAIQQLETSTPKELSLEVVSGRSPVVIQFTNAARLLEAPVDQQIKKGVNGFDLSRAIVHSFGGELREEVLPQGCRLAVELRPVHVKEVLAVRAS